MAQACDITHLCLWSYFLSSLSFAFLLCQDLAVTKSYSPNCLFSSNKNVARNICLVHGRTQICTRDSQLHLGVGRTTIENWTETLASNEVCLERKSFTQNVALEARVWQLSGIYLSGIYLNPTYLANIIMNSAVLTSHLWVWPSFACLSVVW